MTNLDSSTDLRRSEMNIDDLMASVRIEIARSWSRSSTSALVLVGVHEALRRRAGASRDSMLEPTASPARFDPSRWPEGKAERLRAYEDLVDRVRERLRQLLAQGSRLAVVSRGDERLLDIPGLSISHHPQDQDGRYAGHYPPDAAAAIEQICALASARTEYLVLPATAYWWLDHYLDLASYLLPLTFHSDDDCTVFDLRAAKAQGGDTT